MFATKNLRNSRKSYNAPYGMRYHQRCIEYNKCSDNNHRQLSATSFSHPATLRCLVAAEINLIVRGGSTVLFRVPRHSDTICISERDARLGGGANMPIDDNIKRNHA